MTLSWRHSHDQERPGMVVALPCSDIAVGGPYTWVRVGIIRSESPGGRADRVQVASTLAAKAFGIYGPFEARDQAMTINSGKSAWARDENCDVFLRPQAANVAVQEVYGLGSLSKQSPVSRVHFPSVVQGSPSRRKKNPRIISDALTGTHTRQALGTGKSLLVSASWSWSSDAVSSSPSMGGRR